MVGAGEGRAASRPAGAGANCAGAAGGTAWRRCVVRAGLALPAGPLRGSEVRLLGKASSINVRKVLWLAAELELPLAREDWGSGFRSTAEPAFLALNPNAQVPVLMEGEGAEQRALWESNTICRYLAARAGRDDLLPREPWARARVEQWMDWQATDLNTAWRYVFMARVRRSPAFADVRAAAESAAQWNRLMVLLEAQLAATAGHVAGPSFTLADIVIGLSVQRWRSTPMEAAERSVLPAVEAYWQRLGGRAGFAEHVDNGVA